jgi:antirestriction protein ArdC
MEIDMRNPHQIIADKILAALKAGDLPWIKPWASKPMGLPKNASTGRAYSGANVILLWITQEERGYFSDKWLTLKQANAMGGKVRKGETSTMITFVSRFDKQDDAGNVASIPFLKTFPVFNVEQCEGLNLEAAAPLAINTDERDAACDAFIAATGAVISHGGERAFYRPSADNIQLPAWERFTDRAGYYATALHELVHWTGHESRCARDFGKRFGDNAYAAEELVAELGAAFLCAELGIDAVTQHAAYIQHWIKLLEGDPRAFMTAASKASSAVEFLRDKQAPQERAAA